MTTLIYVRHGEAEGNLKRHFHGFYNSALTPNGREQIKRAAARLADTHIDAIYSSDLTRAYETALEIAKGRELTVQIDERFREINGGQWENVPWDDLPVKFSDSYRDWLYEPYKLQMPGGESMADFSSRLIRATVEIADAHPSQTVCIATHGTAIRVLLCYFYGWPLERLNDVRWCDNAAITIVEYENGHFTVRIDGDNGHLEDISTLATQDWWRELPSSEEKPKK